MAVATTPSDLDLLHDARAGDESAFTELYRRHWAAALRVARGYGAGFDAEDLVNTAFERVMLAVRRGRGPQDAFRPYLYVTMRHLAIEQAGRSGHERLDDLPEGVLAVSGLPALDVSERTLVTQAFADLPERWQAVLWMVAVEGRQPREVARATGLHPNTVSVLAHRARERLRQTYLQAHVRTSSAGSCTPHRSRLGAYVRGGLGRRQRAAAAEHVAGCPHCERLVAELDEVNRLLARAVLPVFAIGAQDGLALAAGTAGAGVAGAGAGAGAAGAGVAATAVGGGATTGVAVGAASSALAAAGAAAGAMATVAVAATVGFVALAPSDVDLIGGAAPTSEAAAVAADRTAVPGQAPSGPDLLAPPPVVPPAGAGARTLSGDIEVGVLDEGDLDVDAGLALGVANGNGVRAEANAQASAGGPGGVHAGVGAGVGAGGPSGVGAQADVHAQVGAEVAAEARADVHAQVGPEVAAEVQADVGVVPGLPPEVSVAGAWTVGPLGRGHLAIDVTNARGEALAEAEVVVELSAATHATGLLQTGCVSQSNPFELVVGLLRSLTCQVGQLAPQGHTHVSAGIAVYAPGQTATVRVQVGDEVLASAVVPLTPAA